MDMDVAILPVRRQALQPPRWLVLLLALAIALAANALYVHRAPELWPHPDQVIPVKVLQGMQQRGDLDTDWAKADLREHFRVCRYNFAGYLLFAHATIAATAPEVIADERALLVELQALSRVLSALTLALVFLLLAHHLGLFYGLAGALAVALVPQLYQDAHYARPEALSTFVFTLSFAVATLRPARAGWRLPAIAAMAVLAGFLASIKFTHAVAVLLAVPLAFEHWRLARRDGRGLGTACGLPVLLAGGVLLGFAIGAPAALADPAGYLAGVEALQHQYGSGHPPHGRMGGGVGAQASTIAGYYLATGGLLVLALHVAGYAGKALAPAKHAFAAIALLTLAGFLLQKVFFERNFSLLMPAFIVIALVGLANLVVALGRRLHGRAWARPVALAVGAVLFVASQLPPFAITRELSLFFAKDRLEQWRAQRQARELATQAAVGADAIARVSYGDVFARRWPQQAGCRLYIADTYGDDWSARFLRELPARYRVVAVIDSAFASVPTSTLHVYHSSWRHLFVDTSGCAGNRR